MKGQDGERFAHVWDLLDLLGHQVRKILEVLDVEFDQQVIRAGDRVGLGETLQL